MSFFANISALLGLGGLAVAALSLWLSYRLRSSRFQEVLYGRRVEAAIELAQGLGALHTSAQAYIHQNLPQQRTTKKEPWFSEAERMGLRNHLLEEDVRFFQVWQKWSVILPDVVGQKIKAYVMTLNGISAPQGSKLYPMELVNASDPGMVLGDAYLETLQSLRSSLAIAPLEKGIAALLKSGTDEDDRAVAKAGKS